MDNAIKFIKKLIKEDEELLEIAEWIEQAPDLSLKEIRMPKELKEKLKRIYQRALENALDYRRQISRDVPFWFYGFNLDLPGADIKRRGYEDYKPREYIFLLLVSDEKRFNKYLSDFQKVMVEYRELVRELIELNKRYGLKYCERERFNWFSLILLENWPWMRFSNANSFRAFMNRLRRVVYQELLER